jgi:ketosteroid isomerase-like protein
MALSVKVKNAEAIRRKLERLPQAASVALRRQLDTEVEEMVAAMKRAAPDDQQTGGSTIRDAIRAYPTPDREISFRIISDGKDEKGHVIAAHVEHGHKAKDGSHVAARPTFYPTYRARKKPMQRRLMAAARKAIRAEFGV